MWLSSVCAVIFDLAQALETFLMWLFTSMNLLIVKQVE